MNTLEIIEKIHRSTVKGEQIINKARQEHRDLTEEEMTEYNELIQTIEDLNKQKAELEKKLEQTEEEIEVKSEDETEETEQPEQTDENKEEKKRNHNMNKFVKMVRNARNNEVFNIRAINSTVAAEGGYNNAKGTDDLITKMKAKLALKKAGAKFIDVDGFNEFAMPVYAGSTASFVGETGDSNGEGAFTSLTLKPKRISCYIDVTDSFLHSNSNNADEILINDLVDAVAQAIEKKAFSDDVATANAPAGLLHGVVADTTAVTYAGIVDLEAQVEANNYDAYKYIVSPSAKAKLRTTATDAGSGVMIMDKGEIGGVEVISTSNVKANGVLVGDWSDVVVATWGDATEITVDNLSQKYRGVTRIICNFAVDFGVRRSGAIVGKILKA